MERISTGNPQLDCILAGGLPANSINVLMGVPGSGKTILAGQLAFANATAERPVLYLSTLSEPLPKMITYLQTLSFADIDRIGKEVIYDSLSELLISNPDKLLDHLMELIKEHRPCVIVIDSFKALVDMIQPELRRSMVFELANLLSAYATTSLWVGEYSNVTGMDLVEFAIADGIIELNRSQAGSRDDRFLRIAKLRGSSFLDGYHAFSISGDGLQVYPRLVSMAKEIYKTQAIERLRSGIAGLDDMIKTGWRRGTSTLVIGPSGSGKTMTGLHFLREGVIHGETGLLVNFQENPAQIRQSMISLGWDADSLLRPDRLGLIYNSPVELQIDTIVRRVLEHIEQCNVKRVVLDALGDLERCARDTQRFTDYIYALIQDFSERGITTLLTMESELLSHGVAGSGNQVSYMSDNILLLSMDLGDDLTRTIRIIKSRGSDHDGGRHILRITNQGILVE
jgi:circadian clock protein KaiC